MPCTAQSCHGPAPRLSRTRASAAPCDLSRPASPPPTHVTSPRAPAPARPPASRRVVLPAQLGGGPALGPARPVSGVCGDPLRAAGLGFVRDARQVSCARRPEAPWLPLRRTPDTRLRAARAPKQPHSVVQVIDGGALGLALVGCGGVTAPGHVWSYLAAGADVVTTATGFMFRARCGGGSERGAREGAQPCLAVWGRWVGWDVGAGGDAADNDEYT